MMRLSVKGGVTACIANSVDLDQARQNLDPDLQMPLINAHVGTYRTCITAPDKCPC